MSLKARIRALEVKVEWVARWGKLRQLDKLLTYAQTVRQFVDQVSANPAAAARLGVADLVESRPHRTGIEHLIEALAAARAAAPSASRPPDPPEKPPPEKPAPEEPPREEPPPEGPPPLASPPQTEAWTHDPPEHMQIEKVTWGRRGPQDDLEDEQAEDGYDDALEYR